MAKRQGNGVPVDLDHWISNGRLRLEGKEREGIGRPEQGWRSGDFVDEDRFLVGEIGERGYRPRIGSGLALGVREENGELNSANYRGG